MKLTIAELVYLNDAAKNLKQKDFILINNIMIGIDNIQNILTYIVLDNNFFINYLPGAIINQRSLSAFIKGLTIESEFNIEFDNNISTIKTNSGVELLLHLDPYIYNEACNKYKQSVNISSYNSIINDIEAKDIALKIQSMSKSDGGIGLDFNGYYITIFPSILPLNKSDKLYITIYDELSNIFTTLFRIHKKKFDIMTYVSYLKI